MSETVAIKRLIIRKLVNSTVWGHKHTPLDFVTKSLPGHFRMRPAGQRAIEKALKELRNERWIILLRKRTGRGYDWHVSLNPEKNAEIQTFLVDS